MGKLYQDGLKPLGACPARRVTSADLRGAQSLDGPVDDPGLPAPAECSSAIKVTAMIAYVVFLAVVLALCFWVAR